MKSILSNHCTLCGEPSTHFDYERLGYDHPQCHALAHKPMKAVALRHTLAIDAALAGQVLDALVPPEQARQIVAEFNRRLMAEWAKKCKP